MQKNTMVKLRVPESQELLATHILTSDPSPWVSRFIPLIAPGGLVLDLAAGGGRHGRLLIDNGFQTVFIDHNTNALKDLVKVDNAKIINADLETGTDPFSSSGPLYAMSFDAIVVANYLYRPLFASLINALTKGGVLIYETFALGNEKFARPRNPDHLLRNGELLKEIDGKLQIIAYEHGRVDIADIPGVKQRICAINDLKLEAVPNRDPPVHALYP